MGHKEIQNQKRVQLYGEVFTPNTVVNNMLSMLPEEELTKTYLEPACGNGNFLIRILDRKLKIVEKLGELSRDLNLVKAISSIYGIDIQIHNVNSSITRMMEVIKKGKPSFLLDLSNIESKPFSTNGFNISPELENVIRHILKTNIQHANTLDEQKEIYLMNYKFNEDKVSIAQCPLKDLTLEIGRTPEVHFMRLGNLCINLDDSNWDF